VLDPGVAGTSAVWTEEGSTGSVEPSESLEPVSAL